MLSGKLGLATIWIDQRDEESIPTTMIVIAYYHIHKPLKCVVKIRRKMRRLM